MDVQDTIERENIHAIVIQPTLLNLLLDEHNSSPRYPLRSLRHVVSSGEKLFSSTASALMRAPGLNAQLWNMYGATEVVDTCTVLQYSVLHEVGIDTLALTRAGCRLGVHT